MALIKCPECGREVSDRAQACPQCGYPICQPSMQQHASQSSPPEKRIPLTIRWENVSPAGLTATASVDNRVVGSLRLNKEIKTLVSPGYHSVSIESYRGISHHRSVSGEEIEVSPNNTSITCIVKWKGGLITQYRLEIVEVIKK